MRRNGKPGLRLVAALLATLLIHGVAVAAGLRCSGHNLLEELRTSAPESYERVADAAKATINASALLWRIEREGVRPSHLLGTIHLTDDRVTTFSPRLAAIIDAADTVALEIADVSPEATQAAMAKAGNMTVLGDGRRLDRMLSAEHFDKVQKVLARAGVPEVAAKVFQPWVATMIMSVSDCERRSAMKGKLVLDAKIAAAARKKRKPVVGLETIEGQLAAMASVPEDQQLDMLRVGAVYSDRIEDQLETLLQLYVRREIGAAWPLQLEFAEKAGVPRTQLGGFEKRVVIDRNHLMSERAGPMLEKGNVLIAVGALHLPGENGLVNLLRQAGYTLTPLE